MTGMNGIEFAAQGPVDASRVKNRQNGVGITGLYKPWLPCSESIPDKYLYNIWYVASDTCIYIYTYVSRYVFIHMRALMCTCICKYMYTYIYIHNTYIYTYVRTCIHTYIHTHTFKKHMQRQTHNWGSHGLPSVEAILQPACNWQDPCWGWSRRLQQILIWEAGGQFHHVGQGKTPYRS